MTEQQKTKVMNGLDNLKKHIEDIRNQIFLNKDFSKYLREAEFNILMAVNELRKKEEKE